MCLSKDCLMEKHPIESWTDLGMVLEHMKDLRLTRLMTDETLQVTITKDVSCAPGGGKSRTGAVNDIVVHWLTGRQDRERLQEEMLDHRIGKDLIAKDPTKNLPRELIEQFRKRAALRSRRS